MMPGEGERWTLYTMSGNLRVRGPDIRYGSEKEVVPASRLEAAESERDNAVMEREATDLLYKRVCDERASLESALTEALDAMDKHVEHPYTSNPQLGRVAARIRSQIEGSNE